MSNLSDPGEPLTERDMLWAGVKAELDATLEEIAERYGGFPHVDTKELVRVDEKASTPKTLVVNVDPRVFVGKTAAELRLMGHKEMLFADIPDCAVLILDDGVPVFQWYTVNFTLRPPQPEEPTDAE